METEGFGILCDRSGRKRRFAGFVFSKRMETEVCKFPSWTEMEVLLILHFQNGRRRRFANFEFPSRMEMEILFPSQMEMEIPFPSQMEMEIPFPSQMETEFPFLSVSVKPVFRFPCHPLGSGHLFKHTWQ